MGTILVYEPEVDFPFLASQEPPLRRVGSFETGAAKYWQGSGTRLVVTDPQAGTYEVESREHERLWLTQDGRYVLTAEPAPSRYLTAGEVDVWFAEQGIASPEDREVYARPGPA